MVRFRLSGLVLVGLLAVGGTLPAPSGPVSPPERVVQSAGQQPPPSTTAPQAPAAPASPSAPPSLQSQTPTPPPSLQNAPTTPTPGPSAAPPSLQNAPTTAAGVTAGGNAGNPPAPTTGDTASTGVRQSSASETAAPAGGQTSVVSGAGGAAAAAQNATNSADLLARSPASVGVEVQRRNSIVADPRVRGLRSGQYSSTADGGLFLPARLDLDTPIGKFDPGSVRDIKVVKGPYSALYGPAFSHIDLATLGSPRYACGFEWHGRIQAGFQSNGSRWDLLQSVDAGDPMFGFRLTYNNATGNDYRAGDGTRVPASYTSNTVNFAAGLNLAENVTLEFRGLHTVQNNLEFPGLFFDIRQSNTDAYSLRLLIDDLGFVDRVTADVWFNSTAASGDTRQGSKQAFVQKLLGVSFNPTRFPSGPGVAPDPGQLPLTATLAQLRALDPNANLFRDESDTRFAARSVGYRVAAGWGGDKADPYLTLGTDLNAFGQQLEERIRLRQLGGPSLRTGLPSAAGDPALSQNQSIPRADQVTPGLFLQALAPLSARWKVRSGGRVDWVHSSSAPRLVTGNFNLFGPFASPNGFPQGQLVPGVSPVGPLNLDPAVYSANPADRDLTRNDLLLAGFIRSEYKLDDNWTATAAFGHAQRAPTPTELYAAGPFVGVLQQGTSRLIGDPTLRSEHLTQLDFGLLADYEFLTVGANAFYGWIDNYVTYDANRLSPGLTQVVFTNTDLATLAGAEVFVQMDVTDWLTPFGTLAYVQGVDQTARDRRRPLTEDSSRREDVLRGRRVPATEPLPQIPPLESRAGFRLHAPGRQPWWQVEFSARMVSGQTLVAASLGEQTTPGFTVFNVRGFVKLTDNLLVSAGVDNLGDRTYREHLDPIAGNLLGSGALLRPGANFFLNTQWTY
jgi:iron complex outermembrane receptor protein